MTSEPGDAMTLLTSRRALLHAIAEGPADKQSLVSKVGVSRSTVDRGVRDLEEVGLVERSGGTVALTTSGRIALKAHDRLSDTIQGLGASKDLLRHIPPESPPDPVIFQGGTIVESTAAVPQLAASTVSEMVTNADSLRGVALSVEPELVTAGRDAIVDRNMEITIVVPEAVVSRLLGAHEEALTASLEGGIDLRQTTMDMPFGLMVFESDDDAEVVLLVYGESGLQGVVKNDRDPALAWGRQYVEKWIQLGEPL